ncbi:MAG: sugar transferase [Cocleimonas sp.]|nr:sugar transferase [Cocleimonas sp.]
MEKRIFDLFFVSIGVLLLLPVFLVISILIKRGTDGPILFKQIRVGRNGRLFKVFKFRTMVVDAEKKGAKITTGGDPRITPSGQWLRKYKLDELPQLFNVLFGRMSLVGPRPEVPEYVDFYSNRQKEIVLSVLPGITDTASIEFRNENDFLTGSSNPVKDYKEKVLPIKLAYYEQYVKERSLWLDFKIIIKTLAAIIK